MSKKGDGGPAFPGEFTSGMTLRDWFAGQALAGLMADPNAEGGCTEFAETAYNYADAMLAERAKQ